MDLPSSEVNEVRKRLGNVGEVLRYMISRIDSAAEAKTKLNKKEIEI
jgi:hypothetical protein